VAEAERKDTVFILQGINGQDLQSRADRVSKICSRIGKAAGIVANTDATSQGHNMDTHTYLADQPDFP